MRKGLLLLAVFALASMTGCAKISALFPPDLPENTPIKEARWLDQNWSNSESFWFHHASQGTSTLPVEYAWFIALEQPELSLFGDPGLLADPDYLSRFGFIPSPKQIDGDAANLAEYGYTAKRAGRSYGSSFTYNANMFYGNPDGLPVGFVKQPGYADPTTGKMLPDQIGFTCAACHTGQMEYKGISMRVDGAPAVTDLGKLRTVLGLALAYTNYVPGRFGRFADRVLGEEHTAEQEATLEEELKDLLDKGEQLLKITNTVADQNVEEGFARLDALNRIGTQLFFADLLGAKDFDVSVNLAPTNAPVNYPHIWSTSWFLWVQYDASIMQPMIRNAGEALGVSAKVNLLNPAGTLYDSSVPVQELYDMEQLLAGKDPHSGTPGFKGLRAPAWPEDILGAIDQDRKQRGQALYQELCQSCHLALVSEPAFWTDKRWQAPNAAGESYLNLFESPVVNIGTDPAQAEILGSRDITLPDYLKIPEPKSGDKAGIFCADKNGKLVTQAKFGPALAAVVEKVADAWYAKNGTSPEDQERLDGYRENCIQARNVYKARPLNGIWATAPFLHNGSVPTMYDLLLPVAERPKTFYLGSREYDPEKMGYRTDHIKGTFNSGFTNVSSQTRSDPEY